MNKLGYRLAVWQRTCLVKRRGQLLPRRGEKWWYVRREKWDYLLHWRARDGIRVIGYGPAGRDGTVSMTLPDAEFSHMAIRRRVPLAEPVPLPALPSESKVLAKCPLLREFLSATAYDDATARQPGYMTLRTRVIEWELTLYDPDAGARVAIRSRSLDDVFAGAELLLGDAQAAWEPDRYLMEQLQKRAPKKKK